MELPHNIEFQLKHHQVINLAYTDNEGIQACAVFYVYTVHKTLAFASSRDTRHGKIFSKGPTIVAFTINEDKQSWDSIKGIQGRGIIKSVTGSRREEIRRDYQNRYPFITDSEMLGKLLNSIDFWEVVPKWIRYINNQVKFGYKEEFSTLGFP